MARGDDTEASDPDLLVIGTVTPAEVVSVIRPVESRLAREITPAVYSPEDAAARSDHHFLRSVLEGEKLYVLGDDDELGRRRAEWLASSA